MKYKIFIPTEDHKNNQQNLSYNNIHLAVQDGSIFVTYCDEYYSFALGKLIKVEFCFIDDDFYESNLRDWEQLFAQKFLSSSTSQVSSIKCYRLSNYEAALMSVDVCLKLENLSALPSAIVTSILMNLDIVLV